MNLFVMGEREGRRDGERLCQRQKKKKTGHNNTLLTLEVSFHINTTI